MDNLEDIMALMTRCVIQVHNVWGNCKIYERASTCIR